MLSINNQNGFFDEKEQTAFCYHLCREAWYCEANADLNLDKTITIGLYDSDGGCSGEFNMTWVDGPKIEIFADAMHLMDSCQDFFRKLGRLSKKKSDYEIDDVITLLKKMGALDLTQRFMNEEGIFERERLSTLVRVEHEILDRSAAQTKKVQKKRL